MTLLARNHFNAQLISIRESRKNAVNNEWVWTVGACTHRERDAYPKMSGHLHTHTHTRHVWHKVNELLCSVVFLFLCASAAHVWWGNHITTLTSKWRVVVVVVSLSQIILHYYTIPWWRLSSSIYTQVTFNLLQSSYNQLLNLIYNIYYMRCI